MKLDDVHDLKIDSAGSGSDSEVPERHYTKDFGLIPIPRHLRYDPSKPFHFGIALNVAFGFASTFSESDPLFRFFVFRAGLNETYPIDDSCCKLVLLSTFVE
jgi:hypothetical protein